MHSQLSITSSNAMVSKHAVIILAGGLSQRLGQPKQLLIKNGQPLIVYTIEQALQTNAHNVILIKPVNHHGIQQALDTYLGNKGFEKTKGLVTGYFRSDNGNHIQLVDNPNSAAGMAYSLSLGIDALKKTEQGALATVLIMGVDQVLLDKVHLLQLLDTKNKAGVNNKVVASQYLKLDGKFNCLEEDKLLENKLERKNIHSEIIGLPIAIDYTLLKLWQSKLSGDKGLRHLIRALPKEDIDVVVNNNISFDVDTLEQLQIARQKGWLDT